MRLNDENMHDLMLHVACRQLDGVIPHALRGLFFSKEKKWLQTNIISDIYISHITDILEAVPINYLFSHSNLFFI